MTSYQIPAIQRYYNQVSPSIVDRFGTHSLQAGTLIFSSGDPFLYTNRWMARRAGIRPNQRILDAGCGMGGPAIDIASGTPGLYIDGITVSDEQIAIGTELIARAGLQNRVRLHKRDYHDTQFEDNRFDVAYFFETSGYSDNLPKLYTEMARVLKPGGTIYLKAVVHIERALSTDEQQTIAAFNQAYVFNTPTVSTHIAALQTAGFTIDSSRDISNMLTTAVCERLSKRLNRLRSAESQPTSPSIQQSGAATQKAMQHLIRFAEIRASTPR